MVIDSGSRVSSTNHRQEGDQWQAYSGPLTLQYLDQVILYYFSVDKVGNTETIRSFDIGHIPLEQVGLEIVEVKGSYSIGESVTVDWYLSDPQGS
jgi:hypothetical protein